jgi:hypothetical protein
MGSGVVCSEKETELLVFGNRGSGKYVNIKLRDGPFEEEVWCIEVSWVR